MDYNLAALKLLCVQLKSAQQTTPQSSYTLGGILFQRAWLQGVLISEPSSSDDEGGCDRHFIDDGTGVVELFHAKLLGLPLETGMYVMVVGAYVAPTVDLPMLKVHKLVDLSAFPYREPMWYLEVIEAFKLFYQPMFEE